MDGGRNQKHNVEVVVVVLVLGTWYLVPGTGILAGGPLGRPSV